MAPYARREAVCEYGQSRPFRPLGFLFAGGLLFFCDGCLEGEATSRNLIGFASQAVELRHESQLSLATVFLAFWFFGSHGPEFFIFVGNLFE